MNYVISANCYEVTKDGNAVSIYAPTFTINTEQQLDAEQMKDLIKKGRLAIYIGQYKIVVQDELLVGKNPAPAGKIKLDLLTYNIYLSSDENANTFNMGRMYAKDKRDTKFNVRKFLQSQGIKNKPILSATAKATKTSQYWNNTVWSGDQGNTPMCVGYAWAHYIEGGPVLHNGTHPVVKPLDIYNGAQQNDEWPGPPPAYDGTSVRGGAKWLKLQSKISSYMWATDITTLTNYVLNVGPVVMGTNWYYNMFFPDKNGLIKATGYLAGGHAYVIDGVDVGTKLFRIKNSWGLSWGKNGCAYISFADVAKLLGQLGESCMAVENNF